MIESVSEGFVSPVVMENSCPPDQDVDLARPSRPKSPRIEGSLLENIRASLKEVITSEIKNLLLESQREMLRLLKPETRENVKQNNGEETENETRSFCTPTKSVRTNSIQNNDTNVSRNMVTGVLTDFTNHPKRSQIKSQSQPASKERHAVARTIFGAEKTDNPTLPMPKALTASLPTFDGKTENFELLEELFRNNIKMYPHITELQKINYFHSLLRGDALQAFCNIEDAKKDSLEEIMTFLNAVLATIYRWQKPDVNGTHSGSTPQRKSYMNSWTSSKKLRRRPPDRKPNNSLTRLYTPKCLTTFKRF